MQKAFSDSILVDYAEDLRYYRTWKHTNHLSTREDIDYAYLLCEGDLDSACPKNLLPSWAESKKIVSSIFKNCAMRSVIEATRASMITYRTIY